MLLICPLQPLLHCLLHLAGPFWPRLLVGSGRCDPVPPDAGQGGPLDLPAELARCTLFQGLPSDGVRRLRMLGRPRTFAVGSLLLRQGDPSDCLHVIVTGRVRAELSHPDRPAPVILAELGPGEVVGDLGLLDGRPRAATARALDLTETLCLAYPAEGLALLRHPAAGARLATSVRRRRRVADWIIDQALLDGGRGGPHPFATC